MLNTANPVGSPAQAGGDNNQEIQPQVAPRPAATIEQLEAKVSAATNPQQRMSALGCLRSALAKAGRVEDAKAVRVRMDVEKAGLPGSKPAAPKAERRGDRSRGRRDGRRSKPAPATEADVEALNDQLGKAPVEKRAQILGMLGRTLKALGHKDRANSAYRAMDRERNAPGSTIPREREERRGGGQRHGKSGDGRPRGISPRRREETLRLFDKPARQPGQHDLLAKKVAEALKPEPKPVGVSPHPSGQNRAARRAAKTAAEAAAKEALEAAAKVVAPKKRRTKKAAAAAAEAAAETAAPFATVPTEAAVPVTANA